MQYPELGTQYSVLESQSQSHLKSNTKNRKPNPVTREIQLRNVRVNNLQGVDLDIPHGQWIAFCGLSGSGKSSLAFDTLYAEGQRRYIESLSPHTRQFISQLDKPDADRIDGIPPAIAVKAFRGNVGRKTTVGTSTEITEYMRLMFARIGRVICPDCNISVSRHNPQTVAQSLSELADEMRYQIVFGANEEEDFGSALIGAQRNGFSRAIVGDTTLDLSDPNSTQLAGSTAQDDKVRIVVDRLKSETAELARVRESIELAFQFGCGQCEVLLESRVDDSCPSIDVDGREWFVKAFSRELRCHGCNRVFPAPEPRLFSFNNKFGACEHCDGIGYSDNAELEKCEFCNGSRLNRDALSFRIGGKNLFEIGSLKIQNAVEFFESLNLNSSELEILRQVLPQIKTRLSYLCQVGLPYLTLDRSLRTLSAGEAQRVSLTACLSSTLVNMLYVLDEPSVGLHSHDTGYLAAAISKLHGRGNTVVVVDHDAKMISSAQRIVEIGPGAGVAGGEVVFDGTFDELLESESSITGDFLAGRRGILCGAGNRRAPRGRLRLVAANGHNLQNIDVEFPLGCLCAVTGVSGAGKSSLVQQTLYGAICKRKEKKCDPPLGYKDLFGDSQFDEVVLVDQSPIGRSPRSNPVTYVKAFDDIRRTFAETLDAKTHNVKVSQFSFNVAGGRCDKCEGAGQISIDMQFLSDIYIVCDQCRGTRYRDEVLTVKYRGRNIAEALDLTVREAFSFFRGQPKVQAKLKSLIDVGLDYIRLGQPATTLSSGEAQRLKLGHYLNASKSKRVLFILDEPTTGLHMSDVTRMVECFDALLSVGHSIVVVEHNLQLIKNADWIIDLGPGAADDGGRIVAQGTPEDVATCRDSVTGRYLKEELEKE
jgi:excinuclease ABC subunit A